jgi:GntR family transcriptional regulator
MNASHHAVFSSLRFAGTSNTPLYIRLKRLVEEALERGDLRDGDAIPSEREAAELLDISRVTVRKAFTELVRDGLLEQRRGSGTFVRTRGKRIEQPLSRLTSFSEDMRLRGLQSSTIWLDRSSGLATPEEALKLSLSPSEMVCRFHRVRLADSVPIAVEMAVVPHRFLDDPATVGASLYTTLEQRGFRPVRALQRLHATALPPDIASMLAQSSGGPALFIERITYLSDGQAVEYTRSHYRGETNDFVA